MNQGGEGGIWVVDILQNARRARQSELEISAGYAAPAK